METSIVTVSAYLLEQPQRRGLPQPRCRARHQGRHLVKHHLAFTLGLAPPVSVGAWGLELSRVVMVCR